MLFIVRGAGILCINDEDCDGPHSICIAGVCNCPSSFELFALDQKTQVCRPGMIINYSIIILVLLSIIPAPSKIGDKCQSSCRPPLVCQNNQCVCWKADVVN